MKNLIRIIVFVVIATAFVVSCSGRGEVDNDAQPIADSVIETAPEIIRGKVIEDTVIGHWTIKIAKDSNEIVVGEDYCPTRDSSVFLTLLYDHRVVYSDKEIRTKDIVGSEGEYFMWYGGNVSWVSDSAIYLSFGCFIPASDDGWRKLLQILPDGTCNHIVIEDLMGFNGFYDIDKFMALYFNEKAVGASYKDLKRLFDYYCTKEVAEALSSGTIQIGAEVADFRHAYLTTKIDVTGEPYEWHSFEVVFKPHPNDDNVADTIYMVFDEELDKISRIDTCAIIDTCAVNVVDASDIE